MADDSPFSSSNPTHVADDVLNQAAQTRLRTIIERIERLEVDKATVMNDIKEVFAEAKGEGFDVKVLKEILRLRKLDKDERDEQESLLDLYLRAMEVAGAPEAKAA